MLPVLEGDDGIRADPVPSTAETLVSARAFRALHGLAVATVGLLDPRALARAVAECALDLFDVEEISLYAEEAEQLVLFGSATRSGWLPSGNNVSADGFRAEVMQSGQPLVVNDFPAWPRAGTQSIARGVRSVAAAPLMVRDRAIGVLVARSAQLGRFDQQHLETLLLLAAQVGPAIEAARLRAESERQRTELETRYQQLQLLYRASQAVLHMQDVQVIAHQVLQQAMAVMGCDVGAVQRYDPEADETTLLVAEGYRDEANLPPPRGERSLRLAAIHDGRPQVFQDLPSTGRYRSASRDGVVSLLVLPVVTDARILGVLLLGSRTPREFTPDGIQLMQVVASQLGIALQKADFAEQTRRTYAELEASEARHARLATILEATTDLVAIANAEGRRLYVNRAGRQLLGMAEDADLSGMTVTDNRPAWAVEQQRSEIFATAVRIGMWQGETAYLRADGTEVPVSSVVIAHFGPDGAVEYYSTIARDISGRKRLEEQLLQAQRLEAAGRIAGQVAHDFNNLLAPLAGYPELIKMHLPPDHIANGFCDEMVQAAHQIAEINDDLLTLGRRGYFEERPVDLNQVVTEAAGTMPKRGPRLLQIVELTPSLPFIWGSAAQLVRVLTNLLANARDAMPAGGQIDIRTSAVVLERDPSWPSERTAGQYVCLEVSDTGSGIPPEIQDRIFDPFFTTKTTDRRRGSGLGLSVVRAVVEDHHGWIDFTTDPSSGTTFRIFFPATDATEKVAAPALTVGGDESILVVDDDRGQRSVVRTMLNGLGYQVSEADSGEAAVAQLTGTTVDLVILDMLMPPGIDGAETYRRLQALHPGLHAVVLSGFAESDRVNEARALGVSAYLRKPVSLTQLARVVRQELDRPATVASE